MRRFSISIARLCSSQCCSTLSKLTRSYRRNHVSINSPYSRPPFAPKPEIDVRHIRQNPGLYEQNCIDRNNAHSARNAWIILELHEQVVKWRRQVLEARQRSNAIQEEIKRRAPLSGSDARPLLEEAKKLKAVIQEHDKKEDEAQDAIERLALELPNLSSQHTPTGNQPDVIDYINGNAPAPAVSGISHVEIGKELDVIDFDASANTSGWGWYFLKNEGALLEQALVQYALSVAMQRGWTVMSPPSLVYSHIASACGFMPRDQHGETQIYRLAQEQEGQDVASLVLAGTAEVPFAGSQTKKTLLASALPIKVIGPSRCYRAEAGARGVDTKGLYRVHEFTKVEMFAWTAPPAPSTHDIGQRFGSDDEDDADASPQTVHVFDEMLSIQREIINSLGLHARVLEMPSTDLGASAARKVDMEVFFPSRTAIDKGYGEVTSASICTDYQSRRLGTRVKFDGGNGKLGWAHTVNGTALAVPRILAALLENGWDGQSRSVRVPECLLPWIPGGIDRIRVKSGKE